MADTVELLTRRATRPEVAQKLLDRLEWWKAYAAAGNGSLDNNPSPGNKAGGLTTILEKSLGAVAKGGQADLAQVYEYAEPMAPHEGFVFMDTTSYEQLTISDDVVGDAKNYLLEEQVATVALHEGNPLYIDLPASVELEVTYTEPGLQGDRSTGGTKPATLETGLTIQVPLFVTQGDKIRVDTRDNTYIERV